MENNYQSLPDDLNDDQETEGAARAESEKSSLGGAFNSGVTSQNDVERDEINKQATMKKEQPGSAAEGTST